MTAPTPYYADDTVTLYHGDCREIVPALGLTAALVIADPPYEETGLAWDRWPDGWLDVAAAVADSMWCFLPFRQFSMPPFRGIEFAAAGWKMSQDIEPTSDVEHDHVIWEKNTGSGMAPGRLRRVHEPASHWYRGRWGGIRHEVPRIPHDGPHQGAAARTASGMDHRSGGRRGQRKGWVDDGTRQVRSVIRVPNMRGKAIHPTEKPTNLLLPLIQYGCPPGGLVVDPFAGSCSTGVAARLAGRRAVLIEDDEAMCEKAVRLRLADVFAGIGASDG